MSTNPFGENIRIVDGRKVDFQDINRHVDLQPGDPMVKIFAKLPIDQIRDMAKKSIDRGDFQTADRARAAEAMRRTGVPPELTGPGQLYAVESFDPRVGRSKTEYFGDIGAYFGPLMTPPMRGKINREPGVEYQEVKLKPGERVQIVKDGR